MASIRLIDKIAAAAAPGAMPPDMYQSLPILMREASGTLVTYFFCPSAPSDQGATLVRPPEYLMFWDLDVCLECMRRVQSGELPGDNSSQWLGAVGPRPDQTPQQHAAGRLRLLSLYEEILPVFRDNPAVLPPGIDKTARAFQTAWNDVLEAPLQPYYEIFGAAFFGWLRRLMI